MKGYKGFNDKLQCTPEGKVFQYEVGKEYVEPKAELCQTGFHFCENPLDVLRYYQPATGRYAEVEAEEVSDKKESDSKRVSKKLKIVAEIKLKSLIDLGVKFLLEKADKPVSGDSSPAATSGEESIACSIGVQATAKSALGNWIVLAEYKEGTREVLTVKTAKVDGKKLKADTFYKLKKGKFIVVE